MFGTGMGRLRKRKSDKYKQEVPSVSYDPKRQKAVIRCSICTGEQVAGFQDRQSGRFEEVMLIRGEDDLRSFKKRYGISEITKVY